MKIKMEEKEMVMERVMKIYEEKEEGKQKKIII